MIRAASWVSLMLLVASCRSGATNVVLASLDRSERIDLLCAQGNQVVNQFDLDRLLPLSLCDPDLDFPANDTPQLLGGVTQTETGTVAVVNFTGNAIFDTNRTIPGVTAIRVGEQPTGIQISSVDPRYTYVTSFSPKSLQAISTREVITGSPVPPPPQGQGTGGAGGAGGMGGSGGAAGMGGGTQPEEATLERQEIRFDVSPTDLVLHELATSETLTNDDGEITGVRTEVAYRFIYVALPELGQVAQVEVVVDNDTGEQTFGTITPIQLPTYDCESAPEVTPPLSDDNDYSRICPADTPEGFIKAVDTTIPCTSGLTPGPSPVSLTLDRGRPDDFGDDVLLVADANQPVIHRFRLFLNGATPLDPLGTRTPTTAVSVTPYVPASSDRDDRAATQRYLYAISATDSSVLAIDYAESSDTFGAVLPVIAGLSPRANEENVESRNRVRSGFANARAIEVISPFYEVEPDPSTGGLRVAEGDSETDICNPSDPDAFALAQNPRNMRGVFLAVSLSSGQMFFLDVYDLNAPCRGGQGPNACTDRETGQDRFAHIRRHRRRWRFTPSTFISIDGTPSLQFNAAPGVLDETTGRATASDGPGLELIECPPALSDPEQSSMINLFGVPPPRTELDGLICASSQVWSSFTQRWDARWQGLIPNSEGGLGLFSDESFEGEPGTWFLAGDVPFCQIGVLGRQTGAPSGTGSSVDLLRSYRGDRVVITGELPPSTRNDERCKDRFEDLLEDVDDRQVWFPIVRAFDDQLEIGPSPRGEEFDAEVRRCFNQFTAYQIHTRNAYTVVGTTSGFIHAVIPDETTGECVFDASRVDDTTGFPPRDPGDVDTYLTGRAFPGAQFTNPLVSFEIGEFDPSLSPTDSTIALLNFNILNQFQAELLDTGAARRSLPASMLFSPERDQLFFVDFHAGVRRIVFSPLSIIQSFD